MSQPIRFLFVCAVAACSSGLWAAPGFGKFRRKSIELETRQPALVRLSDTTIAFRGSSTNPEYKPVEASLIATLETALVGNEKTLVKKQNPADAEWVLDLKVTGYGTPQGQQITQNVGNTVSRSVRWTGSLNAAYQVLDHSGRVHDANNISASYDKEFGGQVSSNPFHVPFAGGRKKAEAAPNSPEDVKQILIRDVVAQIASNLGNTTRGVDVELAGGDEHLNRACDFMDQKLWQRAIDELQGMQAFAKPEDESYRQYDLGLAYEAAAYDSKSGSEQRASIYKAAEYYDQSVQMNAHEKYFITAVARTKDAIARYRELDQMKAEDLKKKAGGVKPELKTLRVGDVVNMYTAGVTEDQIVQAIRASPIDFNPMDTDTMIVLAKNKVPIAIQNEMRKKVGAPLLGPAQAK
jgi:hypothetical protein